MEDLILEVKRIKSLMGIKLHESLLYENPINLIKNAVSNVPPGVFDNLVSSKNLLKQLNDLIDQGPKLSTPQLDDLAKRLNNRTTYAAAKPELDMLIGRSGRLANDVKLNTIIDTHVYNVFDVEDSFARQIYIEAENETKEWIKQQSLIPGKEIMSVDDITAHFESTYEGIWNKFVSDNENTIELLKFDDYYHLHTWARERWFSGFNKKLKTPAILDDTNMLTYRKNVRGTESTPESVWKKPERGSLKTDTDDIKPVILPNFHFLHGVYSKFKEIFSATYRIADDLAVNLELLKNFPETEIFDELGNVTEKFKNLVQRINLDNISLIKKQGDDIAEWEKIFADPEMPQSIKDGINKVPIFEKRWGGLLWMEEKFSVYIDRIKAQDKGAYQTITYSPKLPESTLKMDDLLRNATKTVTNPLGAMWNFIKNSVRKWVFSVGIYGLNITVKNLSRLFTRKGFSIKPFLKNLAVCYFVLYIVKTIIGAIKAVITALSTVICVPFPTLDICKDFDSRPYITKIKDELADLFDEFSDLWIFKEAWMLDVIPIMIISTKKFLESPDPVKSADEEYMAAQNEIVEKAANMGNDKFANIVKDRMLKDLTKMDLETLKQPWKQFYNQIAGDYKEVFAMNNDLTMEDLDKLKNSFFMYYYNKNKVGKITLKNIDDLVEGGGLGIIRVDKYNYYTIERPSDVFKFKKINTRYNYRTEKLANDNEWIVIKDGPTDDDVERLKNTVYSSEEAAKSAAKKLADAYVINKPEDETISLTDILSKLK